MVERMECLRIYGLIIFLFIIFILIEISLRKILYIYNIK